MNVKRFFGRTNKEALARLRAELGPDAVVLKNRAVEGGVEILAMADHDHVPDPMPEPTAYADEPAAQWAASPAPRERVVEPPAKAAAAVPEMTTLSFQQYVRDRLARTKTERAFSVLEGLAGVMNVLPTSVLVGVPVKVRVAASKTSQLGSVLAV